MLGCSCMRLADPGSPSLPFCKLKKPHWGFSAWECRSSREFCKPRFTGASPKVVLAQREGGWQAQVSFPEAGIAAGECWAAPESSCMPKRHEQCQLHAAVLLPAPAACTAWAGKFAAESDMSACA